MNYMSRYYELQKTLNESVYNNESSVDVLLEMLSIRLDLNECNPLPLTESSIVVNEFSEYIPLIEAVDVISSAKEELSKLSESKNDDNKKDTILAKSLKSVKKLIDWWYKIEPDKKFKTLHTVLKVISHLLIIFIDMYISFKISDKVLGVKAVSSLPDKTIKIGKNVSFSIKSKVVFSIVNLGLSQISDFVGQLSCKLEYLVNKKDLDKNISEIDKTIDKLNDLMDKTDDFDEKKQIKEYVNNLSKTLAKLTILRDNNTKNKDT